MNVEAILKPLFTPLKVGPVTLPNRLVQGPLAGYSSAPFRVLATRYGDPGFTTTEMISASDLIQRRPYPKRFLWRDIDEKIVSYQLSGHKITALAAAAQIVSEWGADIIDLNCGCPVKKMRSKHAGSKLLREPDLIYQLVDAMKHNSQAAISIKIRIGEPLFDSDDIAVAHAAEAAGADFITVHGRHWTERYDVPCRFDAIARITQAVNIPVFANGDIDNAEAAAAMLQATGASGIMIARASVGNPWLFQAIRAAAFNEPFTAPTLDLRKAVFREHVERLIALENEATAILQSRKLAKYYTRHWPNSEIIVQAIQAARTWPEFLSILQ